MAKKVKVECEGEQMMVSSYKDRVSEQYRTVCAKTGEFFREVVKFGALLNEIESSIADGQGKDGEGLKGWLAENCPDVNYNTAAGYKAMAAKCAKMIGGGTQAIACLQYKDDVLLQNGGTIDVPSEVIEARDALFDEVDSRRKLEQMWFQFLGAQKGQVGRPVGTGHEYKKRTAVECAVATVFPVVNHLLKHRGAMFTSYKVLPDQKLSEMLETLEEHVSAIKDELKRRG